MFVCISSIWNALAVSIYCKLSFARADEQQSFIYITHGESSSMIAASNSDSRLFKGRQQRLQHHKFVSHLAYKTTAPELPFKPHQGICISANPKISSSRSQITCMAALNGVGGVKRTAKRPGQELDQRRSNVSGSGSATEGMEEDSITPVPLKYVVQEAVKRWFEDTMQEASRGDVKQQALLGQMYAEGYGVQQDLKAAKEWTDKANSRGYRMQGVYCEL